MNYTKKSLIAALLAVIFTATFGFGQKQEAPTERIEADVAQALAIIESAHFEGRKIDYNELFKSSIDSMLHTLDPHSNYFDAKEFEQFRTDQNSQYFGIGAQIGDLSTPDGKVIGTFIKATFEGAPAHRAGLRFGDKIVEVNGVSMLGKNFTEVRSSLRGPRGTPAKMVVEKYATGAKETVEIIRDAVPQPSISESYMIRPGVGFVSMSGGFNKTTSGEFERSLRELKAQGAEQLIIDLRNNGGGLVREAFRIANKFLNTGDIVVTQKGRVEGAEDVFRAENTTTEKMPIVVLVNRNSASASEILTGALQDHDRALIVGENTFGKGLVQNQFQLIYGSMLLLTIAKYETPSGRDIQRDYSDGNLYNYYTKSDAENELVEAPKGAEAKTEMGRKVYGGDGITPDVAIAPQTIPAERARAQSRLSNPIFAFALELAFGRVPGFEIYKVDRQIEFGYDLKATDFKIGDDIYAKFKDFAVSKYNFKVGEIEREKEFVQRILRTELVTAAYGATTALQVFNDYDTQLIKAIELLPQAKQLAVQSEKLRSERLPGTNK